MPRAVPAVETLKTLFGQGSMVLQGGSLFLKIGVAVPLTDEAGKNVDAEGNALPADASPVLVDDVQLLPVVNLVGITDFAVKEFVRKNDTDAAKKQDLAKKVDALKKAGLSLEDIQAMFQAAPGTAAPADATQPGSTPAGTEPAPTVPATTAATAPTTNGSSGATPPAPAA